MGIEPNPTTLGMPSLSAQNGNKTYSTQERRAPRALGSRCSTPARWSSFVGKSAGFEWLPHLWERRRLDAWRPTSVLMAGGPGGGAEHPGDLRSDSRENLSRRLSASAGGLHYPQVSPPGSPLCPTCIMVYADTGTNGTLRLYAVLTRSTLQMGLFRPICNWRSGQHTSEGLAKTPVGSLCGWSASNIEAFQAPSCPYHWGPSAWVERRHPLPVFHAQRHFAPLGTRHNTSARAKPAEAGGRPMATVFSRRIHHAPCGNGEGDIWSQRRRLQFPRSLAYARAAGSSHRRCRPRRHGREKMRSLFHQYLPRRAIVEELHLRPMWVFLDGKILPSIWVPYVSRVLEDGGEIRHGFVTIWTRGTLRSRAPPYETGRKGISGTISLPIYPLHLSKPWPLREN